MSQQAFRCSRNNVNKLLNNDACLFFIASSCRLTQVGMHYKSYQLGFMIYNQDDYNTPIDRVLSWTFYKLTNPSHNTTFTRKRV